MSDPPREREGEPRPGEDAVPERVSPDEATVGGTDADEEPVRPGDRLGPYVIVELLGRGGMGVVYRARDSRLERDVALKCPRLRLSEDADVRRRFLREARAAAALAHPHIVPVYEILEWEGRPWVAMELVEGASLSQRLRETGPPPLRELLRIGEGVASALAAAHAKGILHRDVNPNNILVRNDGWPLLTDFGLALLFGHRDAASTAIEETVSRGQLVGTRFYLSPEQILGRTLDGRSDLFSLGAVLYEMATGRRAFATARPGEELDAILHRTPPPIDSTPASPAELEPIVRRAMAKDPAERYPDAAALAADLAALRRRVSFGEQIPQAPQGRTAASTVAVPAPRPARTRIGVLVAAAAGLVVVIAIGLLGRASRNTSPVIAAIPGTPRQITSDPGAESEPAISPDGNLIAYTSNASGNPDVWLVDASGGGRIQLTSDPSADFAPAWFPDGGAIAFVSERSGERAIWKVPKLGGPAVLLLPSAEEPAISPDGQRIAYLRWDETGARVAASTLAALAELEIRSGKAASAWAYSGLAWSPDGSRLVYSDGRDLWESRSAAVPPRRLTSAGAVDVDPAWSSDGRSILFSSLRDSTRALWRIAASGGDPVRLTVGSGPESQPALSRDRKRLAYSTFADAFDLALVELETGRRQSIATELDESAPDLAADGSALVYVTGQSGAGSALWLQALDGGAPSGPPRRIAEHSGSINTPELSPDGAWVAFKRETAGRREIWIVAADGGPAERFSEPGIESVHPAWSPAGDRLAYAARVEGEYRIRIAAFRSGHREGASTQVAVGATGSTLLPAWSPDGGSIAFLAGDDQVWVAPAGEGTDVVSRAVAQVPGAGRLRWAARGTELWIAAGRPGSDPRLVRVALDGRGSEGALEALDILTGAAPPGEFDLSSDGRLLVYTTQRSRGDIWLVESRTTLF